ncbi:MAG TPA: NAD(P)/FAD-dependent oxidoreductase [Thermoleophilaceae bacterium]|nr:NAD(P)/FAD-dependent oxidoreductase [Thermoleophilaceae bacterium]
MPDRYDAVILGGGPAGEHALGWLLDAGLERLALVERELIGGECSNWACIPTKTLLRPGEAMRQADKVAGVSKPGLDWPAIRAYRDYMTSAGDDSGRQRGYEDRGVEVIRGAGRLDGPGRVAVGERVLETERVLVATGSEAVVPPLPGLEEAGYWTNREATTLDEVPASAVVLGGGAVGTEIAQILGRLGAEVVLVQRGRPLPKEDERLGEIVAEQLRAEGIDVRTGGRASAVRVEDGRRIVTLDDGTEAGGEVVIVATGRRPRTEGLGLDSIGAAADPRTGIAIDERCRVADGVWAAGDVTGVALFTHNGKYQARIAVADMLGRPAKADYSSVPRVVFLDPEVAAVGLTEADARAAGIDAVSATIELPQEIARPYTFEEDPKGTLSVVADRERAVLVGAWAVAPLASEWIHQAGLAIRAGIPLEVLRDTVPQFPSFSEAYHGALRKLDA